MQNKEEIKEEVPVTTTDNAGQGLTKPELPMKKDSIFKRYKDLKKKRVESSRDDSDFL